MHRSSNAARLTPRADRLAADETVLDVARVPPEGGDVRTRSTIFRLTNPPACPTVILYYISSTVSVHAVDPVMFKPNPASGVPIYLQLMEQVKHSVETGALRPGEQLPGIRPLAEELVINPNTVAKAYRELEHEGVIELRHGAGAFVSSAARATKADRHAARRPGGGRRRDREAARPRRDRRGDPAAVRSRARRPQPGRSWWLSR